MDEQEKHYADKLSYEIDSWDLQMAPNSGENLIVVKELIGGLDWWKRDGHPTEGSACGGDAGCGCA